MKWAFEAPLQLITAFTLKDLVSCGRLLLQKERADFYLLIPRLDDLDFS
jgi:hypothetical protein